uniref:Uncharacterized protein n=1 Tax=Noctiluca scintillans TaxID=2966 RepID=A0A7S1AZ69_NOCSC|mmetsp:Transcript_66129/g.175239  ORF Transcript_66129/g.175239 Transcript_66129/m.175239 type:complete len:194 (+) Transcript_66129:41-622(+)
MFGGVLGRGYGLPNLIKIQEEALHTEEEPADRGAAEPAQSSLVAIPEASPATLARAVEREAQVPDVRDELMLIREEMRALRAAPAPPPPVVQPMQFIINNTATLNSEQKTVAAPVQEPILPAGPDERLLALKKFFASPLNRFAVFSAVALCLYNLHDYLQNKWRMAEIQKVKDANFFFRFGQMFGLSSATKGS